MRNGLAFLMVLALFKQCSFLPNETAKKPKSDQVCNALNNFDVGAFSWQKVPKIDGEAELAIPISNPKVELEWLRYFQISDREADEFSGFVEEGYSGNKSEKWLRKKKEDGLQSLVALSDPAGNCKQLSARVDEKNSLFERHLDLEARFLPGDTVALLQISGFQKIIFTDPIQYHVQYIATKP